MWQFQWMLSLIPDALLNWIYWGIIAVGITGMAASWLGRWIPFYGNYVRFLKPIGIVLVILGVWLRGGYDVEMAWRAKTAEVQAKVDKAEAESKTLNADLEKERSKKQKVRVEYYTTVKERIVEKKVQIDAKCEIDPVVPKIHNDAATNPGKVGKVTVEGVDK
jgi:hypothetical protein